MKQHFLLNSLKVEKIIYFIVYLFLSLTILYSSFIKLNINYILISIFIFILSLIPWYIEKKGKIFIPPFFKSSYILFIFGSIFLGEILNFYDNFFWWDIILHFSSAIALGMIGFTLIHSLTIDSKIESRKFLNFLFSLSFAVFIGVIWEFIEYWIDSIFNTTMQDSNSDTMQDLIIDTAGAFIGAYSGVLFLNNKLNFLLSFIIKDFFNKNFNKKNKKY